MKKLCVVETYVTCAVCLVTQLCPTLCDPMDCSPPGSSVHGDSPGKNTGVGYHALLQGIFPTQGSNPGLPHCKWTPPSEPPGKPKWPRDFQIWSLFMSSSWNTDKPRSTDLVHWEEPEGSGREGGGRRDRDGEYM